MTSRDRILSAFTYKKADRIPFTWGNGIADETLRMLGDYLHINS